jgi:predicted 3-demethylubiquinone-9 3-methyltransferase (glyoxalase superfamily)
MGAKITQKITPFLWFDDKAEEAANFYTSIFKNSKIGKTTRYDEEAGEATGRPAGSVMTVEFELEGQQFVGLNGGSDVQIHRSHLVCSELRDTRRGRLFLVETLRRWRRKPMRLAQGQIRFVVAGRSRRVNRNAGGQGRAKAKRVTHAMLQMDKIDIPTLKKAYDGK